MKFDEFLREKYPTVCGGGEIISELAEEWRESEIPSVDDLGILITQIISNKSYEVSKDFWTAKHCQGNAKATAFKLATAIRNLLTKG